MKGNGCIYPTGYLDVLPADTDTLLTNVFITNRSSFSPNSYLDLKRKHRP